MRRDQLLLGEMIEAADRAHQLTGGVSAKELQADRLRAESLLWNFTVLGEAVAQLSDELMARFPDVPWQQPARLRLAGKARPAIGAIGGHDPRARIRL